MFSKKTFPLIKDNLADLKNFEIKYNGKNVETLSLTMFAFWNSGIESIRKEDLATNDPLRIVASENTIIYDVEINDQNKVNNFVIEKIYDSSISINFDFMNYNDGIVLSIYHSGRKSLDISVVGTLIGAKKISLGVRKNLLLNRLEILLEPANYLMRQKNPILLGFSIIAGILTIIIVGPIAMVLLPIDFLNDKLNYKSPKQFYLYDN